MIRLRPDPTDQHVTVPTERFLKEVEKRPCLWDPTHRLFREENTRKLAFRVIVGKLIKNAPEERIDDMGMCLEKKWKGIREHYFNTKRDPSKLEKYSSNRYFQLLAFLEPTLPLPNPGRDNIKSAPAKAVVTDRTKTVALDDQKGHKTNNFIARLLVSSSSRQAVKSSTSLLRNPTDKVSSTLLLDKDPECVPEKRTPNVSTSKLTGQPQTTVMIDGVEFEQVTLDSGEVIIKLKEEVLEDCPPPIRMDNTKEKPVTSPVKIQKNYGKQEEDQSTQLDNQNEQNGILAHPDDNQVVSESLHSDSGRELKRAQHSDQQVSTQPISDLKITSTTTLASAAWLPLSSNELKITSTTTLASNRFLQITNRSYANLSPSVKFPKATARDRKIVATKDQKMPVNLGAVDNMVKFALKSSNQMFKKLGDALKSPDKIVNWPSDSKEATIEESISIKMSDNESSELTTPDARVKFNRPAKHYSITNGPEQWGAELKRIGALSKADFQQDGNISQHPNYGGLVATHSGLNQVFQKLDNVKPSGDVENLQSENTNAVTLRSCSAGDQRSPPNLTPVKKVRTNRNTEVLKNRSNNPSSPDDLNISPSLTPTKKVRTNLNSLIPKSRELTSYVSDDSEQVAPQLKPAKMVRTNRNTVINMSGLNEFSFDNAQETQMKRVRTNRNTVVPPNKRIRTDRNEIIEKEPGESKLQPSKSTEILGEDESAPHSTNSTISEDREKDSPSVDEDRSFLLSLLPEMKSMTETQNFDFRLAVMEALSRAKLSSS